jgi:iron(III) transport system ATP-binding protein
MAGKLQASQKPQPGQGPRPAPAGEGAGSGAREDAYLEVTGLTREFGAGGVRGATFTARRGQLITLLGPSGCGKTTTLRCLGGIEIPDAGLIRLGDRVMTDVSRKIMLRPERRDIGMVFQSYALWPHMTVFDNVAFPLKMRHDRSGPLRPRVEEMLDLVGLEGMSGRRPSQLSGGQQQRVALARALIYRPSLLLLDEPLSNLDAARRDAIRRDIGRLQQDLGITAVYVTHDQDEAMMLSDRIIVMNDGLIVQEGTPAELLASPQSLFVARLLGQANVLEGVLATEQPGPGAGTRTGGVDVQTRGGLTRLFARVIGDAAVGDKVSLVWRPGDLTLEPVPAGQQQPDGANKLVGEVTDVRVGSSLTTYTVDAGPMTVRVLGLGPASVPAGSAVAVSCPGDRAICLNR